ncbi:gamma-carboxygeranoyl-CoA hydratase [Vibrio tubiashii]|nr:gamma-carboxygeranoyl-CoA hydratase [Vibrio tubiashii]
MPTKQNAKSDSVVMTLDHNGVASLSLNRPRQANAFNAEVISQLIHYLDSLSANPCVRALVISGNGKHFSAGADIEWMRSMVDKTQQQNQLDAFQLATLLEKLDRFPHPTIAVTQGCAYGGALGLICCCDMVIAHHNSEFCLSEVKLGLIPATIAPYVIRAMGVQNVRRYMLSAEKIDAVTACSLGLVHKVTENDDLRIEGLEWLTPILNHSPQALIEAKKLCHHCYSADIDDSLKHFTSELIAKIRVSPQGQEGLSAFLNKRSPNWPTGNSKE